MKIKKFAPIALALTLASGCQPRNTVVNLPEIPQEVTTITFFGNKVEPENVTVIEEIISQFMAENQTIRVSYESLKGTDYFDALEKRMASGQGDDVFMVNHDVVLQLQAQGHLADLSGLSTLANYNDLVMDQMRTESGAIYWLPTTISVFGLYCNLDLLREHRQEIPQTWPQWEAVCDYFVAQGITPIIANNDISLKTLALGASFYTTYQNQTQKALFDQLSQGETSLAQALGPGLTLTETLISRAYVDAETTLQTKKTSDDLEQFAQGGAPFMLTGAWAAGRVSALKPDFDFVVTPLPILQEGSMIVVNPDTRLSVNAGSAHYEAAMQFVEYFTRPENIQKFADQQASLSPIRSGQSSSVEAIKPLIPAYQNNQIVIGSDSYLQLPIWNITAEMVQKQLRRENPDDIAAWLDQQGQEAGDR